MSGWVCPKCLRIYMGDVQIVDGICWWCASCLPADRGNGEQA